MRTVLRAVTTRYGVVGILVLAVLVVVTIARLLGGEAARPGSADAGADPYPSVSHGPDDGLYGTDGGKSDPTALPSGVADPRPVAEKFATAWADRDAGTKRWRARLAEYATPELKDRLAHASPASGPGPEITGEPELVSVVGHGYAEVSIDTDDRPLLMSLRMVKGRWAVDSIEWSDS